MKIATLIWMALYPVRLLAAIMMVIFCDMEEDYPPPLTDYRSDN